MINSSFWVYFWHCKTGYSFLITLKREKTGKYFSVFIKLHQREEHKRTPRFSLKTHFITPIFCYFYVIFSISLAGDHTSSLWQAWKFTDCHVPKGDGSTQEWIWLSETFICTWVLINYLFLSIALHMYNIWFLAPKTYWLLLLFIDFT